MPIPSYDDLTPSIPDVSPGDVFTSIAAVLPRAELLPSAFSLLPSSAESSEPGDLYAALHDAAGTTDRLMAIAREFSPRIEQYPGGTIVLDVSGLQRLFGGPQSIAEHLARAGAEQVAVAVSQTAAILLARARCGVTVAAGEPDVALRTVPLAILEQFVDENQPSSAGLVRRSSDHGPRTTDHDQRTSRRARR